MKILIIIVSILFVTTGFLAFVCVFPNNNLYCRIFEPRDWKLWEKVCKAIKAGEFMDYYMPGYLFNSEDSYLDNFKLKINVDGNECFIIYWFNDHKPFRSSRMTSVHQEKSGSEISECILSNFDYKHSERAGELMVERLLELAPDLEYELIQPLIGRLTVEGIINKY